MLQPLGVFRPTPGTPVAILSAVAAAQQPMMAKAHAIMIQALHDNVGRAYIGRAGMSRAGRTDLYAVLAIPTSNSIPSFSAALTLAPNAININDVYIDVDQPNDGVIVSILVA